MRIFKGLVLNDYGGSENYATMVAEGIKKIETRMNRLFSHRGDVIICCGAGKSVTQNAGFALCIVNIWKGREMLPSDVDAAKIEWHPKRKSLLLNDWRHFDKKFLFAPCAIQKNFQGLFDMYVPENITIIPRPDIIPFVEKEHQLFQDIQLNQP